MPQQAYNPTASEWLAQADRFLDRDGAADLKKRIGESLRARAEKARLELQRLKAELRDLDGLADNDAEADGSEDTGDTPNGTKVDLSSLSTKKLLRRYVERHPGAVAHEMAAFLREHKGEAAAKHIHSVLYDECKGGGLRKEGEKPNTRYFLADM